MPSKRSGRSSPRTPNSRRARNANGRSTGSTNRKGAGATVLAFTLGAAAAAGAGYLYLHSTPRTPVPSAPTESPSTARAPEHPPAPVRKAEPARVAPFGTSEDVFEAGAHLYAARCATCHGTPQKDVLSNPHAQQLWRSASRTTAAQTPSTLYNQISAGDPARGMPAYAHTLTDTQIWQLALLLKNSGEELPDPVVRILNISPKP
jgi:thiosulfate dehydrogenase